MIWTEGHQVGARLFALSAIFLGFSSCAPVSKGGGGAQPQLADCAKPGDPRWPQCWSKEEQHLWYRGSQGSRLMPEAWLRALEEPGSTTLFMDRAYFDRFNYLPADPDETEPPARKCSQIAPDKPMFPIGFARDCQSDEKLSITKLRWFAGQRDREPWIGLNCAACHTVDIIHNTLTYRVDGAPTLADFQGFTDALREAMERTLADPAKWTRFASRVVGPRRPRERDDSRVQADEAMLKTAFTRLLEHQKLLHAYNETDLPHGYGHGRLDAVGHILNRVAFNNNATNPFRGEPNAPVSYPFIWNANQHDFVQWNGIVPNKRIPLGERYLDVGAIVRNTSEVIGVFADVTTRRNAGLNGYRSSVDIENLHAMEVQLGRLASPAWPDAFGKPDTADVRWGERLFKQHCAGCHAPLDRTDRITPIKAEMTPIWGPGGVGTDPWMVCNAFSYQAKAGVLEGTKSQIAGGPPLPAVAPTRDFLGTQAIGVLLRQKFKILWIAVLTAIGKEPEIEVTAREAPLVDRLPQDQPQSPQERLAQCIATANSPTISDGDRRILAYKARPLNGIWATAPYLHNGSVKSLFELLLDPRDRADKFWVGNREFDAEKVGYVDRTSRYGSWFRTKDDQGRDIAGNSNLGHDYGNRNFSDAERKVLVEYMKTL